MGCLGLFLNSEEVTHLLTVTAPDRPADLSRTSRALALLGASRGAVGTVDGPMARGDTADLAMADLTGRILSHLLKCKEIVPVFTCSAPVKAAVKR